MARPALTLDLFVGFPSYGGNGGISSEHPDIREWWTETILKIKDDPRIGRVETKTINDTPITMVRNRFVKQAKDAGCHLLMMVDSDQNPNLYKKIGGKPFWDEAFNAIYEHYQAGPLVIGAPYCGPPNGGENVYVFYWDDRGDRGDETGIRLEQYPRQIARMQTGIGEVAALPTGLILYDMRLFDLIEPSKLTRDQVLDAFLAGDMTKAEALTALDEGYFHYEWRDCLATEKASTEDVQNTRDISLAGQAKYGYNPVRCAWDCWIGHHKPYEVGKPHLYGVSNIAGAFRRTVEQGLDDKEQIVNLDHEKWLKDNGMPGAEVREVKFEFPQVGDDEARLLEMHAKAVASLGSEGKLRQEQVDALLNSHKTPESHVKAIQDLIHWKCRDDYKLKNAHDLVIAEVGCWTGETTLAMLDTGAVRWVTAVDNFKGCPNDHLGSVAATLGPGLIRDRFLANTIRYNGSFSGRAELIEGDSVDVADRLHDKGCKFDIIFIDAEHSRVATENDINAWLRLLNDSGFMIGHDWGTKQFPGVEEAVDDIFGEDRYRILHYDEHGGIWIFSKSGIYPEGCRTPLQLHTLSLRLSALRPVNKA